MTQAMIKQGNDGAIESVIAQGDLSRLTSEQRVSYYAEICNSLGLNPLTRPFEYITLNGKLVLYARKDATEQLRNLHKISVMIQNREVVSDVYVVTARATTSDGRTDESIGAVSISNLKGEGLANAFMKAETKAKRRVTLSICGLGILDETEVELIPDSTARRPEGAASAGEGEEEDRLNKLLKKHCVSLKKTTDLARKHWQENYEKLSFEEKRQVVKKLKLDPPAEEAPEEVHDGEVVQEETNEQLIEQIEGEIFKDLGALGIEPKDIISKIASIADGEIGLEDLTPETLKAVRDGLKLWRDQLRKDLKRKAVK